MLRRPATWCAAVLAAGIMACGERPVPETSEAPNGLRPPARAQLAAAGDWPSYNRDAAGTRFSPLAEITPDNVANLVEAWRYPLSRHATEDATGYELTPLAVDGVLYVAAADRVVALAGDSGRELWRHRVAGASPSRRGVAHWSGDGGQRSRVFFTAGSRLIALDAATGEPVSGFGSASVVDMQAAYEAPPTRFEDLLIVGSDARPGSVRAFDARTGADVWVFASASRAGERGPLPRAFSITADVDRAIVYAVFGGLDPSQDDGADAKRDPAFASAIVALDARTGTPRWHFQTVHDDVWGYGPVAPPALLDVHIRGRSVPVLVQMTKQGYMFVLNRVTGEPVFGVEERPVPASDVSGERASPTQPFPARPPPLARTDFRDADIVTAADTTEEHAQFCRELRGRSGGSVNLGPFTPLAYRAPDGPPRSTLLFPGSEGAAGWGGIAVDPSSGYAFVNTMDLGALGWIEPAAGSAPDEQSGASPAYRLGSAEGRARTPFWWDGGDAGSPESGAAVGWPCQKPPWGRLTAVDLRIGEIAWQVPLGITEQLPARRQRTGRPSMGGPIATAGGLVLIGATDDRRFRAFAAESGEQVWTTELDLAAHAVPITYLGRDGKQYVAIVATGTAADSAAAGEPVLLAYSLP